MCAERTGDQPVLFWMGSMRGPVAVVGQAIGDVGHQPEDRHTHPERVPGPCLVGAEAPRVTTLRQHPPRPMRPIYPRTPTIWTIWTPVDGSTRAEQG
jgi:hypothetical protein